MGPLRTAMAYYPYVFHPITVLGVGFVVLIYEEWDRQDASRSMLARRVGAFLGAGLLSLVPTAAYFLLRGGSVVGATQGNAWQMDALVASGLLIAAAITWYTWYRFQWGRLVPVGMQALAAVAIPYAAISPLWNVSGHVAVALMPTLYLTLVARRYWPTLLVPAIMVPNRLVLDAHTWPQALWAVPFTATIVIGVYWRAEAAREQSAVDVATA